jgi:putative membrane protein
MNRFLLRAAVAAAGLWLAAEWLDGLRFDDPVSLLMAALLLGVVNAVVRPLALLLTLPLTVVTFGLFLLVVNGLMLALVALLLPGFHIEGFGDALLGALVVSTIGVLATAVIGPPLAPRRPG